MHSFLEHKPTALWLESGGSADLTKLSQAGSEAVTGRTAKGNRQGVPKSKELRWEKKPQMPREFQPSHWFKAMEGFLEEMLLGIGLLGLSGCFSAEKGARGILGILGQHTQRPWRRTERTCLGKGGGSVLLQPQRESQEWSSWEKKPAHWKTS